MPDLSGLSLFAATSPTDSWLLTVIAEDGAVENTDGERTILSPCRTPGYTVIRNVPIICPLWEGEQP